jgi:hypothetical protein
MANTIRIKRSAVENKVPNTGDLQLGELAVNTFDGKLYTKKDNGTVTIVEIGALNSLVNPVTFNNSGSGASSGTSFDGSVARTISYNTIGAPSVTGANASGTWGISVTGSSTSCTGNSVTATALQTARAINGTTFDGSASITTANWGTSRNVSIGGTEKSVNGSVNVTWATSEIAAQTAITLATARTIWGQNFNGSANVTGNLTAVGNITGTGAVTLTATSAALNLTATGANNVIINTNGSERARITSDGRLGVGSNNPGGLVEISSAAPTTVGTTTLLQRTRSNAGNNVFLDATSRRHTAGSDWTGVSLRIQHQVDSTLMGYLEFNPLGASQGIAIGHNNTARLTVTSAGNVGIGVVNPTYRLEVNGSFAATTKSFIIDHPTRNGYKLRYGSLEGPELGVYVRGRSKDFVIELPKYWIELVHKDSITVNLTPVGKTQTLWVKDIRDNKVYVGSKCSEVEYFFTVFGERADVDRLEVEVELKE